MGHLPSRRRLLQAMGALPFAGRLLVRSARGAVASSASRVRPGDPGWPSQASWDRLNRDVGGRLIEVRSPLEACVGKPFDAGCAQVFSELKNPYFLGDEAGLTQTLGWVGAWTSRPSVYAVAAKTTADVVAAVNFARAHNLRLVVKGGGHSYLGTSNAPDSLLIWTRPMSGVALHDAFVGSGCEGQFEPQPAASIEAGAIWGRVYDAVTVKAGRYVQGGGCLTVGVAGLIGGGGFGSLSKTFGLAAASLLEAEVVTADGAVRLANPCANPDLFWALKGGGGGFGVVTRLTLRTHELPEFIGLVAAAIRATSEDAFRRLASKIVDFYRESLFNPNWGEQIGFHRGGVLSLQMVFHGFDAKQAEAVWRPFFDWVRSAPQDFEFVSAPQTVAAPGRKIWDPSMLRQIPGLVIADDRPGAPEGNIFYVGNQGETGQVLHAYQSAWLPASLLEDGARDCLVDALVAASKHWRVTLHVNKGLAGGRRSAIEAARDMPTNPAAADAFALVIAGAGEAPAYPGVPGHEPNVAEARAKAAAVTAAMNEIRKLTPRVSSYVLETDYFQPDWRDAFWGDNYPRLRAIKDRYDPDGLFFLHHGAGSEDWSEDGFRRAK